MNTKTRTGSLTRWLIAGFVLFVLMLLYFATAQVVAPQQASAAETCIGGTTLISDEAGAINCRDTLGNICSPAALVEGSAGSLRCPTTVRAAAAQCESLLSEDGSTTPEYSACLKDVELANVVDLNQGGEFDCAGVSTSIKVECADGVNPIISYITAIVNFISAGVGIVIIANVMIGGVQYMVAGGNPQVTQAAISRITNAFIALFVFIFMWAFFNWLVPSGILNSSSSSTNTGTNQTNIPEGI